MITIRTGRSLHPGSPSRGAGRRLPLLIAVLLITMLCLTPLGAKLALADPTTTVYQLINNPGNDNKQDVIVQGEVVGDILNADSGHKWLLLDEDDSTISVYVTNQDAQKITSLGAYGQIGTQVEIEGVFNEDCSDHDGLTDIHAAKVTVLDQGQTVPSLFDSNKLKIGIILLLAGGLLIVVHWRLRERTR